MLTVSMNVTNNREIIEEFLDGNADPNYVYTATQHFDGKKRWTVFERILWLDLLHHDSESGDPLRREHLKTVEGDALLIV